MSFLSNLLTIPVVRQNSHISESQIPDFSIFKFDLIKILPPLRFYIYIFPPSKLALLIATQLRIKHTLLVDTMANRRKIMRRKRQSRNQPDRPFKYNGAEIWSNEKKFCRWIEISSLRHCRIQWPWRRGERKERRKNFLLLRAEKERENRRKEKSSSDRVTWSGESFVVVRASFTSRPIPFLLPLPIRDRRYTLASLVILLAPTTTLHKTNLI